MGNPEQRVELVGVTGTNGKTSVTTMVSSLAHALGWNGANIGTLTNARTTPFSPELFRTIADVTKDFDATNPRSVVALEVSSHALDQDRIQGLRFDVVAFTNLSHDHLDYHGSMQAYFEAKASLFNPEHATHAVIWCGDDYGQKIADSTTLPTVRVRREDASDITMTLDGTTFVWRGHRVATHLTGAYNVDNCLMSMEIVRVLGADEKNIVEAVSSLRPIPGRFEIVQKADPLVVVDYAHTPDALGRLLGDVRLLIKGGKIITVFGCGGDRDKSKRPQMGEVASSNSEITIVTSDNPRTEAPDAIIDSIIAGTVPGATVLRITDRRSAIEGAMRLALPGDAVVLAGKGHETTQIVGDLVIPFDDREVAKEFLR